MSDLAEMERALDVADDMIVAAAWRTRHVRSSAGMPSFADGLRRLVRADLQAVRARLDAVGPRDRDRLLARVDELETRLVQAEPTTSTASNAIAFCVAMVFVAMVAFVARSCTADDIGPGVLVDVIGADR